MRCFHLFIHRTGLKCHVCNPVIMHSRSGNSVGCQLLFRVDVYHTRTLVRMKGTVVIPMSDS